MTLMQRVVPPVASVAFAATPEVWLEAALEVTEALLAATDRTLHLRIVAEHAARAARADCFLVSDDGAGRPSPTTTVAFPRRGERSGAPAPHSDPLAAEVIRTGAMARREEPAAVSADLPPAGPALCVPLVRTSAGHTVLLLSRSPEEPSFTAVDADGATGYAAAVAAACELLRRHDDRLSEVLAAHRLRMSHDLADVALQRIAVAGLIVRQLSCSQSAGGSLAVSLQAAADRLAVAIADVQSVSSPLPGKPTAVGDLVLALAADAAPVLGFPPVVEMTGSRHHLSSLVASHLVAVLKELLSNVARHAHARTVRIRVDVTAERLRLQVTDDGRGMGAISRRSGLANLARRASLLGGSFLVTPGRAGGTSAIWDVPQS